MHRRSLRIALIIVLLVASYAVIGFFVTPGIVKSKAIEMLSQYTGQRVAIHEVKINPFALSVTIRGFSVPDSSGARCLGFEEMYLNFKASSLVRRAYTFGEFRVTKPFVRFAIRKGGQANLSELMPRTQPPDTIKSTPKRELPRLILENLAIEKGQAVFEDDNRAVPFVAQFDSLGFSLRDFTTLPRKEGLYEFEASTNHGEVMHWRGNVAVSPLRSAGHLALSGIEAHTLWSYVQDRLKFDVPSGKIGLSADYVVDYSSDSLAYQVHNGEFSLSDLTIADKASRSTPFQMGSFDIKNVDVDPQHRLVQIGLIHSEKCAVQTTVDSLGNTSLADLLTLKGAETTPAAPTDSTAPWVVDIQRIEVKDYSAHITDLSTDPSANWVIEPIALTVDSVSIGRPSQVALSLQAGINHSGNVTLAGTLGLNPITADLTLSAETIPLADCQPYLSRYAKLDLKSGTLSSSGQIHYLRRDTVNVIDFTGDVSSASLRTIDRVAQQDFLRWSKLELKQVDYHSEPPSLHIREIALQSPYVRYAIAADRSTNLQSIMTAPADSDTVQTQPSTSVTVGSVQVSNGSLNFTDLTLTPGFTISIESLNGAIKGLSSEQLARADVALQGKVDKYAPVEIEGQVNPLSGEAFTDITMKFHGIELTTFTPYAGKYAGYRIDKGKLSLDLHYKLSKSSLDATNHVVMDQLTLGERVDGPDVTKLPVRLAIALLKDRHGVIDLDIPVSGDLNDPKFKVMPLIVKILLNLATKAVTAPFALIGSLFGGGEDLSSVNFLPGVDSLDATQLPKLASVAKALTERPQLLLDIRGTASDSADRRAIAVSSILKQVRGEETSVEEKPLSVLEQSKVKALYVDRFKMSPDSLIAPLDSSGKKRDKQEYKLAVTIAALQRIIAEYDVPEDNLRDLARRRASAIKGYLIHQGSIEDARLMLQDVEIKAQAQDGRISLPLVLNAR
ncbi:MAG TPA: DUF748 domain-containing protein [bacterium]|jgi:hypothetical protein